MLHFIYIFSLAMNLLLMWMQQLVVTLTSHQKEVIKLLYQTSGLVILNNIVTYTLYLFLIAEKVLLNSNSLSYCPLKDTFDEYTSDCWTYDGR